MSDLRDLVNARHEAASARSNAAAYGSDLFHARHRHPARHEAASARSNAAAYGTSIAEHGHGDTGMAILLAAEAICAELHALATLIDHARGDAQV